MHQRVLTVPVTREGRAVAVIARSEFLRALAERFLEEH